METLQRRPLFDVFSGIYTPIFTAGTNISDGVVGPLMWMRIGNIVHVSGVVNVTTTLAGDTTSAFKLSLPYGQAPETTVDASGTGVSSASSPEVARIGVVANTTMSIVFLSSLAGARNIFFQFNYKAE